MGTMSRGRLVLGNTSHQYPRLCLVGVDPRLDPRRREMRTPNALVAEAEAGTKPNSALYSGRG